MRTLIGTSSKILTYIVVLLSILGISYSCSKSSMDDQNGSGKENPGANEVWIQGMAFTPSTITVKEGTTITWTNKDGSNHTVTSDQGLFNSGLLASGGTYTYKFSAAGTYQYHCSTHPSMTAIVIVTSASTTAASVTISNMSFDPSVITITAGTTITWTNKDGVPHTVTSTSLSDTFDSGSISNNATFQHTFNTVGNITYKCTLHPSMTGTVVVN